MKLRTVPLQPKNMKGWYDLSVASDFRPQLKDRNEGDAGSNYYKYGERASFAPQGGTESDTCKHVYHNFNNN